MALPFTTGRFAKCLLFQIKPLKTLQRFDSNLTPMAGWLEKPKSLLFHPENIKKHAGVIPIAIIAVFSVTCEILWTIRLAFTRDDVVFLNEKMACEQLETREGPLYPPPVRKFRVYNQKYENCKGAIAAMRSLEKDID